MFLELRLVVVQLELEELEELAVLVVVVVVETIHQQLQVVH